MGRSGEVGGKGGITLDKLVPLPPAWSPRLSARAAKNRSVQGTLLPRTSPHCLRSGAPKSTRCPPHAALSGRSSLLLLTRALDKTLPGIQTTALPEDFSGGPRGGLPHCACCHSLCTRLRARGPVWQQSAGPAASLMVPPAT